MNKHLRGTAFWAITLFLFWVLQNIKQLPEQWFYAISPGSLFQLGRGDWLALMVSFATSLFIWGAGILIGYTSALLAGGALILRGGQSRFRGVAMFINQAYDTIYVVPLVLTVGCTYAAADAGRRQIAAPKPFEWLAIMVVAGAALGGFQIYRAIYSSVINAKSDSRYLIASLDFQDRHRFGGMNRYRQALANVLRLRDCEIAGYCDAVERALHLSIVTVMIVETVIPMVHEFLLPSAGQTANWRGGAGYVVMMASQSGDMERIAGIVWAVLLFDHLVVTLFSAASRRLWLTHYQRNV
jgi:hypothetical protein